MTRQAEQLQICFSVLAAINQGHHMIESRADASANPNAALSAFAVASIKNADSHPSWYFFIVIFSNPLFHVTRHRDHSTQRRSRRPMPR